MSKLGPKIAFLWVKIGPGFLLFFLLCLSKIALFLQNEIFQKNIWRKNKTKIARFWVKTWSNYVARHAWTKFWRNLGPSFDSTFLTFWLFFHFQDMLKPLFYSVFSKTLFFKPTPENRNTICEHNCANWFFLFVFSCIFAFWGFCCVWFFGGLFLVGVKKTPKKGQNSKQNNKKGKMTTRCKQQNYLVVFSKRENQTAQTQNNTNQMSKMETNNTRKNKQEPKHETEKL